MSDPAALFNVTAGPSTPAAEPVTPSTPGNPNLTRMSSRPRMPSLAGREPQTLAEAALMRSQPPTPFSDLSFSDRATRSKTAGAMAKPLGGGGGKPFAGKVKLKLGEKATQGIGTSFLGPYDRELDTDDEEDQDLVFEEQFILKMPPGEDCDKLRTMVQARAITPDVWFKFKHPRRGVFHIGENTYSTKLVDLPSTIEAQKTLDGKQMFKVADICQALVVEPISENGEDNAGATKSKTTDNAEYIWLDGITPPMKRVRKRRFRKRISRAAVESLEQEIERLLNEDARADKVEYKVLENVNPDLSDHEFYDKDEDEEQNGYIDGGGPETPAAHTPGGALDDGMGDEPEAEDQGGSDDDLTADLVAAPAGEGEEDDAEDEDGEDDEDDETEEELDEDEDVELTQAKRLLSEEIRDLEAAVEKKVNEIASSVNSLIKRRFEDALKKLKADLDAKRFQLEALTAKPEDENEEDDGMDVDEGGDDMDDLFGDDEDEEAPKITVDAAEADAVGAVPPLPAADGSGVPAAPPMIVQIPSS